MILPGFLTLMNGNIYDNEYKLGSNYEEENVLMDTRMCSNECSENTGTITESFTLSQDLTLIVLKKLGTFFSYW